MHVAVWKWQFPFKHSSIKLYCKCLKNYKIVHCHSVIMVIWLFERAECNGIDAIEITATFLSVRMGDFDSVKTTITIWKSHKMCDFLVWSNKRWPKHKSSKLKRRERARITLWQWARKKYLEKEQYYIRRRTRYPNLIDIYAGITAIKQTIDEHQRK